MGLRAFGLNDRLGCNRSSEHTAVKDCAVRGATQKLVPAPDQLDCAGLPSCCDMPELEPSGAGLRMFLPAFVGRTKWRVAKPEITVTQIKQ